MLTSVIQVFYQDKMAAVGHLIANDQLPLLSQVNDNYTCKSSAAVLTPGGRQSKTLLTIDERGSKSIETVFSIAICHQSGDKWQSKTLLLMIFYLRSSIVLTFPIATAIDNALNNRRTRIKKQ